MFRKHAFCEILRRRFSFYANKIRNVYKNVAYYGFKYTYGAQNEAYMSRSAEK